MPVAGPFYFAWCDSTDTTFGVTHHRMDEYIFSAKRTLAEGQKPLLELEIENPHVGLLSPERKFWAWFSWFNGTTIVPLFFGRVVGVPSSLQSETLTIQLVAWPTDYDKRVQRAAETLKYAPFWDDVFISIEQRDNPDVILEAHTKVWGVNPTTLAVTADDIIVGEDGNVDFTADDHFYDSMHITIGSPPFNVIRMDATVGWTQTARGTVDMGSNTFLSYSGDGIIADWPKPLQQLGEGWSVFGGIAVDVHNITHALTANFTWSWTNHEKHHEDGDSLSFNLSMTVPQVHGIEGVLTWRSQSGVLDPYAVDEDGDPSPLNIPASSQITKAVVPLWQVNTSLVLRYDAARRRTERVIFLLRADLQPTIVDPAIDLVSETLTRNGADVGVPILNVLNWYSVAGMSVALGQVIFPSSPTLPGGRSAQVAVVAGIAGTAEPTFSDVVGDVTVDGGVHWASLGSTSFGTTARDWTGVSHVPLGEVILPLQPFWIPWSVLTQDGRVLVPPAGVSVSEGTVVRATNGSFQVCTLSGETAVAEPSFSATWGTVTADGSAQWTSLGPALVTGTNFFICIQAGITGTLRVTPNFNNTLHAPTTDGTAIWASIGSGDIPAGGTPGNVIARSYFDSDRGRRSLEYLIATCRAHLLAHSRCVTVTYECEYERGVELTMRKTATLHDPRIPGGLAVGKIKTATLSVDGDNGTQICSVELASCVGFGNAVTEVPGDPVYVADGYVATGYQQRTNHIVLLPTLSDVGYTVPTDTPDDDGLSFPLTRAQVVVSEQFHTSNQVAGINSALASMAKAAQITQQPAQSEAQSLLQQTETALLNANSVASQLKKNPNWYDLTIKSVNGGPYDKVYIIRCTDMAAPQHIDLQAETTT